MKGANNDISDLVDAIQDLTRVMLLLNNETENKSDLIRKLHAFSIPPSRIAALLGIKLNEVTSVLAKAKKRAKDENKTDE